MGIISYSEDLCSVNFFCSHSSAFKHDIKNIWNVLLIHLFAVHPFFTPENIRTLYGFLFSGGRERMHWERMGQKYHKIVSMTQILDNISRPLRLFITNLTSLVNFSTKSGLIKSVSQNRASLLFAFAVVPRVLSRENKMQCGCGGVRQRSTGDKSIKVLHLQTEQ